MNYWKLVTTILVFAYCLFYLSTLNDWHFIDNVNLVIHEAGHVVFALFGNLIMLLGGTILQLLVPIVFILYFVFQKQIFSASLLFYWLAINLFNVSVYVGDAVTMSLPLLTDDTSTHDWNQIFTILGILNLTDLISFLIFAIGLLVMLLGLVFGLLNSGKEDKSLSSAQTLNF
ncbi:MAG TPA: hypothetical protein PKD34_02715 [Candidatus Doudnabacteria bacterium]|nr:hypothetical protein [Candidatus Doudnabacteria bacterium]